MFVCQRGTTLFIPFFMNASSYADMIQGHQDVNIIPSKCLPLMMLLNIAYLHIPKWWVPNLRISSSTFWGYQYSSQDLDLQSGNFHLQKVPIDLRHSHWLKNVAFSQTRWWFQRFFIFTPIWGRFPIWLIFFKGVATTNQQIFPLEFSIRLLQRRSNCPLLSQHQPVVSWNWENIGILFEIGKQPICTDVMQIPMYIFMFLVWFLISTGILVLYILFFL